ncbi:hypothetical protein TSH7_32010 [Azospirillum sp. TSH7]|nr:hypothetical protein TSH7_32010 [Azospirillum sp. TSH7]PWC56921.1 hypothetical protein TSH20_32035 [Azospirillum sp. TSH20]
MLGATVSPAAADGGWRGDHGREWYGPGRGGHEWRGWDRPHHRHHWRERGAYYAPPPVIYAPPPVVYAPPPRVIYAPPPVVYAPQPVVPGFGLSVNIR